LSTKAAWTLPPDATEAQKAAKETQMKMLRQIANKADSDYLHFLVKFQYGEEGTGLLPSSDSFSLVPPEMKKKLENMKQERLKLKRKDSIDSDRRQDYVPRTRELTVRLATSSLKEVGETFMLVHTPLLTFITQVSTTQLVSRRQVFQKDGPLHLTQGDSSIPCQQEPL
jgi:hypothetical protein